MDFAQAYAEIVKYDKNEDGTLRVYGKATDDSLDMDLQICDPAWLDNAMPEWFKSGGNIREQHSAIAAGVAEGYEKKADGHYIDVLVVDPVSVKKVENRVLKGFSIGIKQPRVVRDTKAVNGRIIDGQIVEVSLVDRPANPNAKLVLAKAVEGDMVHVEEFTDQVIEAKGILAELTKFDQTAYDNAREALATLVQVEAGEMREGHDEVASLHYLLEAIKNLAYWYSGEAMEGEVPNPEAVEEAVEDIELAADTEKCAECGEEMKMCKCNKEEKSAEAESAPVEDAPAEAPAEAPEVSEEAPAEPEDVEKMIAAAVDAATAELRAEVAELKAANEAAVSKAAGLDEQLQEALNKAVVGGPKRTGRTSEKSLNDNAIKASQYFAKAAAATDPDLAKGYKQLARELLAASEAEVK